MKKRKKPTGLIIALVVFVGTAAGINAYQEGFLNPATPAPDAQALAESRKTEDSAKTVADQAKSSLGALKSKAMSGLDGAGPHMVQPGQPLISMPKPKKYKPTPSDSSVSGQWYTSEAMKDTKTGGG